MILLLLLLLLEEIDKNHLFRVIRYPPFCLVPLLSLALAVNKRRSAMDRQDGQ